jgi:hypothetical protein
MISKLPAGQMLLRDLTLPQVSQALADFNAWLEELRQAREEAA